MFINLSALTEGERFIVEWEYHLLGGFRTALAEAIIRATSIILLNSKKVFPMKLKHIGIFRQLLDGGMKCK